MNNRDIWIVNPAQFEDECEAIRTRSAYTYTYPFVKEVWEKGAKVTDRQGHVIKKIKAEFDGYIGILDGEELHWDMAGRFKGPYINDVRDMRISERYWYKDWRKHMAMSYAEWEHRFGREHPTVKLPE